MIKRKGFAKRYNRVCLGGTPGHRYIYIERTREGPSRQPSRGVDNVGIVEDGVQVTILSDT